MRLKRVGHHLATKQPQHKEAYNRTRLCVCAQSLSCVQLLVTLWTVAFKVPLSMGFPRQECWSGFPFPSPGDLPNPVSLLSLLHEQVDYPLASWEAQ